MGLIKLPIYNFVFSQAGLILDYVSRSIEFVFLYMSKRFNVILTMYLVYSLDSYCLNVGYYDQSADLYFINQFQCLDWVL